MSKLNEALSALTKKRVNEEEDLGYLMAFEKSLKDPIRHLEEHIRYLERQVNEWKHHSKTNPASASVVTENTNALKKAKALLTQLKKFSSGQDDSLVGYAFTEIER